MSKKPYYITTPIYYPSGNPHIGHCYTTVACDSIARFRRMQGYDVIFLTGTDEHGLKIEQKAAAKGITPKEYVDEVVKTFKALWEKMHVSYDRYIRTTDDYHVETVQKIFKRLYDLGYIYKGEYKGKYCTPCESFWTESQLDENGCCPECHREVTEAKEEAYFMKMAPFAERIEKLLLETDYLQPKTRAVELVNNFIKPGLEDLCVSRTSFTWGIPVTFDTKHVVYVWVDALFNYTTALGFMNDKYPEQRIPRLRRILAGRCPHGCQGHHAFPRHYLAGNADGAGSAAAEASGSSRLDHLQRTEDVQVPGQRG